MIPFFGFVSLMCLVWIAVFLHSAIALYLTMLSSFWHSVAFAFVPKAHLAPLSLKLTTEFLY